MKELSRMIAGVPPSAIRRFFSLVASRKDIISLGVGEPDFATPWHIRDAAIDQIEHGRTNYSDNRGLPSLREAVADYLSGRYGISYSPDTEIMITVGVSEGLDLAMRAILNPGDEVIIPEPCYVSYKPCVVFAGGTPVPVSSHPSRGFRITPEDIGRAVTPRTKAILLSYPTNPTGATLDRSDLQAIADVAARHDLYVISDEIYDRLSYDSDHIAFPQVSGARERTIYLNGFSKAYAMTGWRIAYAAAAPAIMEAMVKIHQYTMLCAPVVGQHAALEALRSGEAQVLAMAADYNRRRHFFVDGLNRIGLPCELPGGAFYAFPSIRSTGFSSDEFAKRLLNEQNVATVPGNAFGDCGEGFIRCSYATSIAKLREALERMERFVGSCSPHSHASPRATPAERNGTIPGQVSDGWGAARPQPATVELKP